MAALASSLIRQKREVKDAPANRPIATKRKACPRTKKSLCQKQILILISKVRLCGGRRGRIEKRPGLTSPCNLSVYDSIEQFRTGLEWKANLGPPSHNPLRTSLLRV
ncbi:UNVERIFIED_CONTAM: hypothetical protein FKN15_013361 [Acipenser sinensis]